MKTTTRGKNSVRKANGFNTLAQVVGENIRLYRQRKGIGQEKLAARAGLNDKTVARLETGSHVAQIDTLYAIAGALEVQVYDLLPRIEEVA